MFTALILVCQVNACGVEVGTAIFPSEEICIATNRDLGIKHIAEKYPGADFVEFACYKWEGPKGEAL